MELANKVLQKYMELCHNGSTFMLQDHIGETTVIDWYGRTIKGKHKIQQFVRYDMCQQYEHKFQKATISGPIECKPTHIQTRRILKSVEQSPQIYSECDITPPYTTRNITLPQVTRGKTFLPDDSFDDLGLGMLQDEEQITPPRSIFKKSKTEEPPAPRQQTELLLPKVAINLSSTDEVIDDTSSYSHLMYIEASGVMCRINPMKHRGVTSGNNSICGQAKETRLRIAYRYRLHDQQIYFPLIIYEQISRNTNLKRNLYMDFNDQEERERREEQERLADGQRKRKTPLKKLFRLL